MTKPNKLFSWLGFGKKSEADPIPTPVVIPEPAAETITSEVGSPEVASVEVPVTVSVATPVEAEIPEPIADIPEPIAELAHEIIPEPTPELTPEPVRAPIIEPALTLPVEVVADKKPGFFARLKQGLSKTSQNLGNGLASLFLGKKIDDDLYEELETQLLMADVGVDTSQKLIKQLVQHADRRQLKDADSLYEKLQQEMASLLDDVEKPLDTSNGDGPFVILMVGVNGVGKTTTIGKMAQQFKLQGKSVMLAAGDTFRAAAVEQLQVWGDRNQIPVIAQHSGADSASVIFDAYQAAKARKIDVLIADTAGRLQNKAHLMEELKKIVRVMKKIDGAAPHEVMLTLDAGTGQNAISQAKLFHEAVELTGISLTKLDGTAKGGVIFAIADQFKLPIRYIGVGESIDDLRVFNSKDFIRALFNKEF
ncbi:signal recognition particle-docking protein FtsY [Rheinheimera sp. SA_1]|uniref:signal recognition particle-docking protein FtsY n=1 Tax=Rheinheimera sp. SA_1 TaxID=1827365 RepID=UPI0007FE7D29|nr:signal recognition particle-docking protein FtsY [Rheinheimera sp. SA_1]OBP16468.1 signal recognition particle-docking protein FtsY [Rheinheimera sp. SA_1]